jgi:hypothetical protein
LADSSFGGRSLGSGARAQVLLDAVRAREFAFYTRYASAAIKMKEEWNLLAEGHRF